MKQSQHSQNRDFSESFSSCLNLHVSNVANFQGPLNASSETSTDTQYMNYEPYELTKIYVFSFDM